MNPVRKTLIFGISSVLLAGSAADAVSQRESQLRSAIGDPVEVLVTSSAVRSGTRLTASVLAVRSVPKRWAPVGALSHPQQAWGMVAAADLPKGAYLGSGTLREADAQSVGALGGSERIATVTAVAAPGTIRAGGNVDVVVARPGAKPVVALSGVEVLAVRRAADEAAGPSQESRVEADLRTNVSGALRLAAATGDGAQIQILPIGTGA
jgi:SAF domain